jgi:hypothetical protein
MQRRATSPPRPAVASFGVAVALTALLLAGVPIAFGQFHFTDINPSSSNLDPTDPDAATGGRVNGLAATPGNAMVYYAASEWGGIYKTLDAGRIWVRLDGHNPSATWDVAVNPADTDRIYATSLYDGRVDSIAGINTSSDAGLTWDHPATALPPAGLCDTDAAQTEPSAFGISIDPAEPDHVYVGTNCGIAVSDDGGSTWVYRSPITGYEAPAIIDVVAHHDGIVDVCGYFGHHRSTDYGGTWTSDYNDLPGGVCSIAASPDDEDVLFIAVGTDIWESEDGGVTWTKLGTPDRARQGRITFITVNDRADDAFDLWFGDIRLYRGACTSSPAAGETHCPEAYLQDDPPDDPPDGWAGPFTRDVGGHDDLGDIVFNPMAAEDACPTIFSSDGGVYYNTDTTHPGCHDPGWEQPTFTPHGLWLWALAGADKAGADVEDIYFGNQDNGTFGTTDGGAVFPTWNNRDCCDGFDFAADDSNGLYTVCCGGGRANRAYLGTPGLASSPEINDYPADGLLSGFRFPDILDTFGLHNYVLLTTDCVVNGTNGCPGTNGGDGGVYVTEDVTANPIVWTELGDATEPPTGGDARTCGVQAALAGAVPTFYVQVGICRGFTRDVLWRFVGTDPAGDQWEPVNLPDDWLSIFAVDPGNPDRLLISSYPDPGSPRMMLSEDGGATWSPLPELDELMIGYGAYTPVNLAGPRSHVNLGGYPQPSLVAFDPDDENILVAGGHDSGVFISTDRGEDWVLVTDPSSTGGVIPHLYQPRFAYFDHEPSANGDINMYIGTRGRGVWRVSFDQPPIADAGGPYTTNEGANVALDGTGSVDPGGSTLTYEWDLDDDGQFDDATGPTPTFELVGQDGAYTVRLKVTNVDDLSDVDEATVTVVNVAPTVTFDAQDPEDEGAPLVVTGAVSDPGWLDPLSATIDWGDGSPPEDVGGVLENVRPDATLTYSVIHCYGDNGSYTVEVCGSDDDTTTCESAAVVIDNVPPSVAIDAGQVTEIDEGQNISVLAHFSDPGWLDTYLSAIDWGYGGWVDPGTITISDPGGKFCPDSDVGSVTATKQYGDNDDGGGFTITVSVADDDLGVGVAAFNLTVNNIDPTAAIDESDIVDGCAEDAFIAHAGDDVTFTGNSTDPGSDDLALSWDWDDGPPAPDVTTLYLVGVPVPDSPDPLPSPEVSPRDVTDTKPHAFAGACFYEVTFSALDDDGGTDSDSTDVVIVGNAQLIRSAGYWYTQYRKSKVFTADQLQCYLDIVNHLSSLFSEAVDADSRPDATAVLDPSHSGGDIRVQLDRQLLALWLNFANGAIDYDDLVDTGFDDVPDTPLLDVLCAAEAARLNPATPASVLENWKNIVEAVNLLDENLG